MPESDSDVGWRSLIADRLKELIEQVGRARDDVASLSVKVAEVNAVEKIRDLTADMKSLSDRVRTLEDFKLKLVMALITIQAVFTAILFVVEKWWSMKGGT